mmetsp:Transcript_41456/g.109325  ORF Transcript_41456/g.109325 Transcript_41456/m.109325 type:complete len:211 (+) Transcript_41456:447-1079(+)
MKAVEQHVLPRPFPFLAWLRAEQPDCVVAVRAKRHLQSVGLLAAFGPTLGREAHARIVEAAGALHAQLSAHHPRVELQGIAPAAFVLQSVSVVGVHLELGEVGWQADEGRGLNDDAEALVVGIRVHGNGQGDGLQRLGRSYSSAQWLGIQAGKQEVAVSPRKLKRTLHGTRLQMLHVHCLSSELLQNLEDRRKRSHDGSRARTLLAGGRA